MKKKINFTKKKLKIISNDIDMDIFKIINYESKFKNRQTKIKLNVKDIQKIINSGWDKHYADSKEWCELLNLPETTLSAVEHLKKILNNIRGEYLKCNLFKKGIGRAYYNGAISMCNMPRELRQALSVNHNFTEDKLYEQTDRLYDYDIENAQNVILLNICVKSKINIKEYNLLQDYCLNRDKWLKDISENIFNSNYKDSREQSKIFMLRALNQGYLKTDVINNTFIKVQKFQLQIKNIFKTYFKSCNEDFYKQCVKNKNNNKHAGFRSFVAKTLQNLECYIVENVISKCEENKLINKNNFDYQYDGFLTDKIIDINTLINYSNELGFKLKWTIKKPTHAEKLWREVYECIEDSKEEMDNNIYTDDIYYTGTHADLADIAVTIIGDDYINCEGNDCIYNWNKTYWKPISKECLINNIKNCLSKFYKNLIRESLQKANNNKFKELSRVFSLVKNNNHIKSVTKFLIYSIKQVEITDLNNNDYEFVFKNCCINLKTGKRDIPQKDKYATLCAGYDYVESTEEQREELTKVLSTILSNKEIRDFTLLLLSTSLVGIPIAKFIIFKGGGRNGKGTLNETMRDMMGDYYYKLNNKTLIKSKNQDRQDINNIQFKRFLLTTEPDAEGKLDSNLMKDICSDDKMINARALYKTDSRVPKKNTTIMECNHLPLLDNCNGQDALSERINIIEFLSAFVSKDDKRLLLKESKRKYYIQDPKYTSNEWKEYVKIALFDILLEYCIKFLKDQSIINNKPDIVKKTNSNYFLSSNEMKEWIVDNYYIGREEDINNKRFMRAKSVLDDFKMSEMYANCSIKDKKKVLPGKWKKLMNEWFPEYYNKRKRINGTDYSNILFGFVKKQTEVDF